MTGFNIGQSTMSSKSNITQLPHNRVKMAKRAFTTRRVPVRDMQTLIGGSARPMTGHLVLARVHELGKHRKLESIHGRRAIMMPGDEIIVCYGNRYAPDQFEAVIGDDLGLCDLVAGGGVASRELNRHDRMLPPTQIMPIGLIGNTAGKVLNLMDYRLDFSNENLGKANLNIKVVLVAGTAMNSGKTYTAAAIIRGLKESGFKVAGIKATGTGSGGDLWLMKDMGAEVVLDFTDAGYTSTYKIPDEQIETAVLGLIYQAFLRKCDFAVVEIADGLQHQETATLLRSPKLRAMVHKAVFAAYDSMGAKAGYHEMLEIGYPVVAISGQLTRSPLAMREVAGAIKNRCPLFTPYEIQAGALVPLLTDRADEVARDEGFAAMIKERLSKLHIPEDSMLPRLMEPIQTRHLDDIYDFDYPDSV